MKKFARWIFMKMYRKELITIDKIIRARVETPDYRLAVIDTLETLDLLE